MATILFYADELSVNLNGSGLGFFGSTFGNSVEVGAWQDTTYITDGNGTIEGPAIENTKWAHAESGYNSTLGSSTAYRLLTIPNRVATLNIRFENDSAVRTQNAKLRIFDRSNINNGASGVVTKVAQLIHPSTNQADPDGSGDSEWNTPAGSSVVMDLVGSPGMSGLSPNGTATSDTRHDWYVVLAASPSSIGAKTMFGLYVELEYL